MISASPHGVPDDVANLFDEIALMLWQRGKRHFSADAILHRIRWNLTVDHDGEWKCNNNHTADLARWFMKNHPHTNGFFELRARKAAA